MSGDSIYPQINYKTCQNFICKYKKEWHVDVKPLRGRPRMITERARNQFVSARTLKENTLDIYSSTVLSQTIRRFLHKQEFQACVPRQKRWSAKPIWKNAWPMPKKFVNERPEFWEKVLFTDKSPYTLSAGRKKGHAWRKSGEAFQSKYLQPIFKSGA